jgi:hypothetical protein
MLRWQDTRRTLGHAAHSRIWLFQIKGRAPPGRAGVCPRCAASRAAETTKRLVQSRRLGRRWQGAVPPDGLQSRHRWQSSPSL